METLETENREENEPEETVTTEPKIEPKRGRRFSVVWKYFIKHNENLARCRLCHRDFSFKTTTSNLKKHLRKKHPSIDIDRHSAGETSTTAAEYITVVNYDNIEIQELEEGGSAVEGDLSPLKEYLKIEPKRINKGPEKRADAKAKLLVSGLDSQYGQDYERTPQKEIRMTEDDDDVFGRFLIVELKKLKDTKLKNRCKRDILSILMEYGTAQDEEPMQDETG